MNKNWIYAGIGTVTVTLSCTNLISAEVSQKKPNVLLILADDLGYNGLHCYGNEWLKTPNIDKLFSQGIHFKNGYSAAPVCQPSRIAILSGQYSPRTGGYRVVDRFKGKEDLIKYIVPKLTGMALDKITIAEAFKSAGYTTAMYGKWHAGNYKPSLHPRYQGFDEAYKCAGYFDTHKADPKVILPPGMDLPEYFTQKATEFMEKAHNEGKPFFLYMPYFLVHGSSRDNPIDVNFFKRHKDTNLPIDDKSDKTNITKDINYYKTALKGIVPYDKNFAYEAVIAGKTTHLDECIGELMKTVARLGIEKDTIIIFTSDNGSPSHLFDTPYRGRKGETYDGGMHVPYIFVWPGKIKAESVSSERIIGVDLYPTLLNLTGIKPPENYPLDGANLAPILLNKEKSLPPRAIYCYYPKYAGYRPATRHWTDSWRNVIFDGNYKLIEYPEYAQYELYNLKDDPEETTNLVNAEPERKNTLIKKLHQWMIDINAPKLTPNPNYKYRQ